MNVSTTVYSDTCQYDALHYALHEVDYIHVRSTALRNSEQHKDETPPSPLYTRYCHPAALDGGYATVSSLTSQEMSRKCVSIPWGGAPAPQEG